MRGGAIYQVTGRRNFRGHAPGAEFEAYLNPGAEARAVARGDIRLIERIVPSLQPGSYRLPSGWAQQQHEGGQ